MKAFFRKDWLKWVAACFALVATASAEYELARAIGMDRWVAIAVPGALDAYVLRALRAHREVLTAVLAMVGVNAASHLLTAGHLYLDWPLITAVSAIAPLVLWRVHALGTPGEARRRVLWNVPRDAGTPEPDGHGELCDHVTDRHACECVRGEPSTPEPVTGCVLGHPECAGHDACTVYRKPGTDTFEEHVSTAPGVLDYVPPEWADDSLVPCRCPEGSSGSHACPRCEHDGHDGHACFAYVGRDNVWSIDPESAPPVPEHAPESVPGWNGTVTTTVTDKRERVLKAVPDLPDGYEHSGLRPGDAAYLQQARVLYARGTAMRDWKPVLGVGTARAQRLRDHIKAEHDASTEGGA